MTIKRRSYNDQNKQRDDDPKYVRVRPHGKDEKYMKNALRSKNTFSILTNSHYEDTMEWKQ